jgi:hypothetical protein
MNLYKITEQTRVTTREAYVIAEGPTQAVKKLNAKLIEEQGRSLELGSIKFICDENLYKDLLVI